MKYRTWSFQRKGFAYNIVCVNECIPLGADFCLGIHNNTELFTGDIIKINNQCYLVDGHVNRTPIKDELKYYKIAIDIIVNRNPKICSRPYYLYTNGRRQVSALILNNFELIGNLHQLEDLKI